VTSPLPAKTWQHRIQPTAPAAPISTASGTIRVGFSTVDNGSYVYNLTLLDVMAGDAPAFLLRIAPDFDAWQVKQLQ